MVRNKSLNPPQKLLRIMWTFPKKEIFPAWIHETEIVNESTRLFKHKKTLEKN